MRCRGISNLEYLISKNTQYPTRNGRYSLFRYSVFFDIRYSGFDISKGMGWLNLRKKKEEPIAVLAAAPAKKLAVREEKTPAAFSAKASPRASESLGVAWARPNREAEGFYEIKKKSLLPKTAVLPLRKEN